MTPAELEAMAAELRDLTEELRCQLNLYGATPPIKRQNIIVDCDMLVAQMRPLFWGLEKGIKVNSDFRHC